MSGWPIYPLPSHPSQTCVDRFSLLPDSEEAEAPIWAIIQNVITTWKSFLSPEGLINILDTLSHTIHEKPCPDHTTLLQIIDNVPSTIKQGCQNGPYLKDISWNTIFAQVLDLALELPTHFPSGLVPTLSPEHPRLSLKPRQVGCLLAHMFLGTISPQPWAKPTRLRSDGTGLIPGPDDAGAVGFGAWFSGNQVAPSAVEAYLTSMLAFFGHFATSNDSVDDARIIEYSLHHTPLPAPEHTSWSNRLLPIDVELVSTFTTSDAFLGLPDGAHVIMANKHPGFGPSATQEEIHVGSTPEACIVSLLCPSLADEEVLVVRGAEPMVIIDGYGRGTRLRRVLSADEAHRAGKGRTMLFMDALELDSYDPFESGIPDLLPGHIRRELQKAYCAFASGDGVVYSHVVTGLWGCGAFGGDKEVKTLVQWCAAALAGTKLKLVLDEKEKLFAEQLSDFEEEIRKREVTVGQVVDVLEQIGSEEVKREKVLVHVLDKLDTI